MRFFKVNFLKGIPACKIYSRDGCFVENLYFSRYFWKNLISGYLIAIFGKIWPYISPNLIFLYLCGEL